MSGTDGALLLTGCTGFLGRRLFLEGVAAGRPVFLLAQPDELPRAHAAVARVTRRHPAARGRVLLFAGDVLEPGLGLASDVADRVLAETSAVVHALRFLPGPRRSAEAAAGATLRAAESLLAFAHRSRRLEAFVHVGGVEVSGDYPGTFYEDWYDVGQGFADATDRAMFEAEGRVRDTLRTLPVVLVRSGILLGDSETGEIDPSTGLGPLLRFYAGFRRFPRGVPLGAPEGDRRVIPVAPVDYVARAVYALAGTPEARGQVFALVDRRSPTLRELLDRVADAVGAPRATVSPSPDLQVRLLGLPGVLPWLSRLGDRIGVPLRVLRLLTARNRHDAARAEALLAPLGITCPPFASYAARLLESHGRRAA